MLDVSSVSVIGCFGDSFGDELLFGVGREYSRKMASTESLSPLKADPLADPGKLSSLSLDFNTLDKFWGSAFSLM